MEKVVHWVEMMKSGLPVNQHIALSSLLHAELSDNAKVKPLYSVLFQATADLPKSVVLTRSFPVAMLDSQAYLVAAEGIDALLHLLCYSPSVNMKGSVIRALWLHVLNDEIGRVRLALPLHGGECVCLCAFVH